MNIEICKRCKYEIYFKHSKGFDRYRLTCISPERKLLMFHINNISGEKLWNKFMKYNEEHISEYLQNKNIFSTKEQIIW